MKGLIFLDLFFYYLQMRFFSDSLNKFLIASLLKMFGVRQGSKCFLMRKEIQCKGIDRDCC